MKRKMTIIILAFLLLPTVLQPIEIMGQENGFVSFDERADLAQESLHNNFWNEYSNLYNTQFECDGCNTNFHYWRHAHAIDVLVDAYERTGDNGYLEHASLFYDSIYETNGNRITIDYYDDMLWMALALMRLYEHTENPDHEEAVFILWNDIKRGWNENQGGGIAWRKSQRDYKNAPSNGPAVILAARLYQKYGNEEDLEWAYRIFDWLKENLVDPNNGFVWDGVNREGDGNIDKQWQFTYNQGVYIGGAVELYRITEDETYLEIAQQTAEAARERLSSSYTHTLQAEGAGDGGLFKGILIRYLALLIEEVPNPEEWIDFILINAESAWQKTKDLDYILFGPDWNRTPRRPVDYSQQLSGIMLMEQAAKLVEQDKNYLKLPVESILAEIDEFNYDPDQHNEESWAILEDTVQTAQDILGNEDATAEELMGARQTLFEAREGVLFNRTSKPDDKDDDNGDVEDDPAENDEDQASEGLNPYLIGGIAIAVIAIIVIAVYVVNNNKKKQK